MVVRRAADRFLTDLGWLDSRHSFSFGHHHDPENVGHGLLIVSNDDRVAPGVGFGPHRHIDMEIVTWVLEGSLRHSDSEGNEGVLHPGLGQRMSAGSGITHSEMNDSETEAVHFVQMWVVPDEQGIEPSYEERDLTAELAAGGLVAVASGRGHEGAIFIHQRDAVMWLGRLSAGETLEIPTAPFVHVFVARGSARIDDAQLGEGDAVRLTGADGRSVVSSGDSELIIWESHRQA